MTNRVSDKELAPFSCTFTPQLPELLHKLQCTLVISTFQAGKVIFISPKDDNFLVQLPRNFKRPMGVTFSGDKMAVATMNEIVVLRNSKELAKTYPNKPNTYDQLWTPRATYYTGAVDIHDLHFGNGGKLWAVNTSFSCLCSIDDDYSFRPEWQPHFITHLAPEDRCHLNGLAMKDGEPKYISALGSGDSFQSWREDIVRGGIIMDVESNEIITRGLAMPHTPRIYNGQLYCLLSAAQKLITVDPATGKTEDVAHLPGFVRGMTKIRDFVFVSTSKLRKNSSTFNKLDIPESANHSMIYAVHLPTGQVTGKIQYRMSVDEIYDIQVLENCIRPNIINHYKDLHHRALMIPGTTFWAQAQDEKTNNNTGEVEIEKDQE